ncbi:exonuclease [Dictyocaulus viviparus]|uniref:RNA exonuclease 4 n=1 Tax=Dictyocaulus viviparus TaxID=29172 RepID=A0A0D8XVU0_DICVI|nr:exonuclease [Dictyocaulus viviparus]
MGKSRAKGAALKVNPEDVSPSWKVLQMNLKEQENSNKQITPRNDLNGSAADVSFSRKPVQSRKRKLQEALGSIEQDEIIAKRSCDIPVVRNERILSVCFICKLYSFVIAEFLIKCFFHGIGKGSHFSGEATPILALDCEYVGGGTDGDDDLLARVSIVNEEGKIVYDKYVKPKERVTDYRTAISGILPANIANGLPFYVAQREVAKILQDRIVVGHGLNNDFRVLNIHHNSKLTRDTAKCLLLRKMASCYGVPSLKKLARAILGIEIQQGEHDSVVDARVALRLYLVVKKKWENDLKRFRS